MPANPLASRQAVVALCRDLNEARWENTLRWESDGKVEVNIGADLGNEPKQINQKEPHERKGEDHENDILRH